MHKHYICFLSQDLVLDLAARCRATTVITIFLIIPRNDSSVANQKAKRINKKIKCLPFIGVLQKIEIYNPCVSQVQCHECVISQSHYYMSLTQSCCSTQLSTRCTMSLDYYLELARPTWYTQLFSYINRTFISYSPIQKDMHYYMSLTQSCCTVVLNYQPGVPCLQTTTRLLLGACQAYMVHLVIFLHSPLQKDMLVCFFTLHHYKTFILYSSICMFNFNFISSILHQLYHDPCCTHNCQQALPCP